MSRILPARFYSADPADLADELIRARQRVVEKETARLLARMQQIMPAPALVTPRRWLDFSAKRERIRALVAAAIRKHNDE